jgi:hypothetical protein
MFEPDYEFGKTGWFQRHQTNGIRQNACSRLSDPFQFMQTMFRSDYGVPKKYQWKV